MREEDRDDVLRVADWLDQHGPNGGIAAYPALATRLRDAVGSLEYGDRVHYVGETDDVPTGLVEIGWYPDLEMTVVASSFDYDQVVVAGDDLDHFAIVTWGSVERSG